MKKVLIITYYWPPSGGSGVQRWLKMSKYLPKFGWQPVIYTAKDAEYPVEDLSLEKDICQEAIVLRQPIVEPYNIYKRFLGIKKENKIKAGFLSEDERPSVKENISRWIRGNFFIPDARCWWIKPSAKFLLRYLKEHPVDAIISTGPPHSMHLIAMKLHKKTNIPWIADFRDPWTGVDFYDDLKLTCIADRKHHRLENMVLTQSNQVVSVGWNLAQNLEKLGANEVKVITNGYDIENIHKDLNLPEKFSISHIGILSSSRNAKVLWEALGELIYENQEFAQDFQLKLIGSVDASVKKSLVENNLLNHTIHIANMPHDKVLTEQMKSHVLLLIINDTPNAKGILTGKIFEYLYAHRPILAVGPKDGDTAKILKETEAGEIIDFNDKIKMKDVLIQMYEKYKKGFLRCNNNKSIEQYSRKSLAKEYAKLLDMLHDTTK